MKLYVSGDLNRLRTEINFYSTISFSNYSYFVPHLITYTYIAHSGGFILQTIKSTPSGMRLTKQELNFWHDSFPYTFEYCTFIRKSDFWIRIQYPDNMTACSHTWL